MRPWISIEDYDYIDKATDLVKRLNNLFVGPKTNILHVNEVLNEIDRLIVEN